MSTQADTFSGNSFQNAVNVGLLLVYAAVVAYALFHHAMWRDELQAWLIARDTSDLKSLLHVLRYEGHPAVWYLLLKPATWLSANPVSMQLIHLVAAVLTAAVVLWLSPFNVAERALLLGSYFLLYEYAVKSRSYLIGCLILFTLCWRWRRAPAWRLAILLAILSNVHFLFTIVSIAGACALLVDRLHRRAALSLPSDILAVLILCAGWAITLATVMPPGDATSLPTWHFGWSGELAGQTLSLLSAIVALPPSLGAAALGGIVVAAVLLVSRPDAAVFLVVSVAGLLAFFYLKSFGSVWHQGVLFLVLIAAIWIDRTSERKQPQFPVLARLAALGLAPLLLMHIYAGISAIAEDIREPLSMGRKASEFIRDRGWAGDPIIGVSDFATSTLAGYLDRKIYYPNSDRWGSYVIWERKRLAKVDAGMIIDAANRWNGNVTLALSVTSDIDTAGLASGGFVEVAEFIGARDRDENYRIYRRPATSRP